ncbi:MAG: hypothetical protein IMHGJWDQ_001419 [Candidatus Fervidibacter sp.]
MRVGMVMGVVALLLGHLAGQETGQLTLNLMPGSAASRIVTGKLKGEWAAPNPTPVELDLRSSTYIVVNNILENSDAVILIQPQGLTVKGKVGGVPLEWTITPSGDLIAEWAGIRFDSSKLPDEQRSKWRKAFTASYELTITPQGRIKTAKMPEFPKDLPQWSEVPLVLRGVHPIVMGLLQMLWLPLLPTEPVKVGSQWQVEVPLTMLELDRLLSLPFSCRLAKLSWDEAIISVKAEHKGEVALSLKRLHPTDPKITVTRGQFSLAGEITFLVSMGVPQKAKWTHKGEISGTVAGGEGTDKPFTFRYEAELDDQLVF